jgi:hypothetical protein
VRRRIGHGRLVEMLLLVAPAGIENAQPQTAALSCAVTVGYRSSSSSGSGRRRRRSLSRGSTGCARGTTSARGTVARGTSARGAYVARGTGSARGTCSARSTGSARRISAGSRSSGNGVDVREQPAQRARSGSLPRPRVGSADRAAGRSASLRCLRIRGLRRLHVDRTAL